MFSQKYLKKFLVENICKNYTEVIQEKMIGILLEQYEKQILREPPNYIVKKFPNF